MGTRNALHYDSNPVPISGPRITAICVDLAKGQRSKVLSDWPTGHAENSKQQDIYRCQNTHIHRHVGHVPVR